MPPSSQAVTHPYQSPTTLQPRPSRTNNPETSSPVLLNTHTIAQSSDYNIPWRSSELILPITQQTPKNRLVLKGRETLTALSTEKFG